MEELAKAKLKAAAAKAASEKKARDAALKKAKEMKELQEKKAYYEKQMEAATDEEAKAELMDQLAELEGTLVGAKEDNAEVIAKLKKLDEAKAKAAKAEKARKAKEAKAAAAKLKARQEELKQLAEQMQGDVKRQGELEDLINGVYEKLGDAEPSESQKKELEAWEKELDEVMSRLTDKGADIASLNEANAE
jgi:colicin import membrane protein